MFDILTLIFKYIFIVIIYLFIFSIIRLIYLDIKGLDMVYIDNNAYLKLINRKESLPFKIDEYYIIDNILTIGRGGANNIVIKDPYISKNHYQIIEDENQFYLEDLKSSNGTFINGDRIYDVVRLKNGDIIKTGLIEFLFVNRE